MKSHYAKADVLRLPQHDRFAPEVAVQSAVVNSQNRSLKKPIDLSPPIHRLAVLDGLVEAR